MGAVALAEKYLPEQLVRRGGDPWNTIGLCIGGQAFLGFEGLGSICFVASFGPHRFQYGETFTGGGGTGVPSYGFAGSVLVSNATSIDQLGGPFWQTGGSVSEGIAEGVDTAYGRDAHNRGIDVSTFGIGPEVNAPDGFPSAEYHFGPTDTYVWRWNIPGAVHSFFNYIGWHLSRPLGSDPQ